MVVGWVGALKDCDVRLCVKKKDNDVSNRHDGLINKQNVAFKAPTARFLCQ